MGKSVSEKTLELNVGVEILNCIRGWHGGERAFWIGMKQNQEARNGIDELIDNTQGLYHLALQFKSPNSRPPDSVPYRFSINDRQHAHLLRLARTRPDAVYYVFPHYNTFLSMRMRSPDLLSDTYFARDADVDPLTPSGNAQGTHRVRTDPPVAEIYSDPVQISLKPAREVLDGFLRTSRIEHDLVYHEALREWLRGLFEEERRNTWRIGQRLRGFSTVCLLGR